MGALRHKRAKGKMERLSGKTKLIILAILETIILVGLPAILENYVNDTVNFGLTLFVMLFVMLFYWVEFRD